MNKYSVRVMVVLLNWILDKAKAEVGKVFIEINMHALLLLLLWRGFEYQLILTSVDHFLHSVPQIEMISAGDLIKSFVRPVSRKRICLSICTYTH